MPRKSVTRRRAADDSEEREVRIDEIVARAQRLQAEARRLAADAARLKKPPRPRAAGRKKR